MIVNQRYLIGFIQSYTCVITFCWSVAIIYFAIKVFLPLFLLYSWLNFEGTKPLFWGDIHVYANLSTRDWFLQSWFVKGDTNGYHVSNKLFLHINLKVY